MPRRFDEAELNKGKIMNLLASARALCGTQGTQKEMKGALMGLVYSREQACAIAEMTYRPTDGEFREEFRVDHRAIEAPNGSLEGLETTRVVVSSQSLQDPSKCVEGLEGTALTEKKKVELRPLQDLVNHRKIRMRPGTLEGLTHAAP